MNLVREKEKELEGLLAKEEIYWKQRSRAEWLLVGDRNSNFFHSKASASKRKNTILRLVYDCNTLSYPTHVLHHVSRVSSM